MIAACPKCERSVTEAKYKPVFYGNSCIIERGCPQDQHLHLSCSCGYWWAIPCADAKKP